MIKDEPSTNRCGTKSRLPISATRFTSIGLTGRGGESQLLGFFFLRGEPLAAFLVHALEDFGHVLDGVKYFGGAVDRALLHHGQRDAVARTGIDLQDFLPE